MEFQKLAEKRYSCRNFSGKKVDPALIQTLIRTANLAPTAVNRQPVHIFWMASQQAKESIRQVTRFTFGADDFLLVGCQKEQGWVRGSDGHSFAEVDGAIVATHIMLQITDLGLATTWVGSFDAPFLKKLCPQMAEYELIAIFPIGYPAQGDLPSERHTQRKQEEELVTVL